MKRIVTALVLIPAVVAVTWWGPRWLLFLAVLPFAGLSLREYFDLSARMGYAPHRPLCYSLGLALLVLAWLRPAHLVAGIVAGAFLLLAAEALAREDPRQVLPSASTGFLGVLYVVVPFAAMLGLRLAPSGAHLILFVLVLIWVGDTAAYYVGRAIGRHKLTPRLSPGKTVEGAVASLLATFVVGYLWLERWQWIPLPATVHAVTLPLALNLAAQVGDLVESALKRGAGVKDSSEILPGHGGMLDRVDSLLLALPTLWYYYVFALAS